MLLLDKILFYLVMLQDTEEVLSLFKRNPGCPSNRWIFIQLVTSSRLDEGC